MRLSEKQIKVLKDKLNSISSSAKLYLFGSRVDDTKKGGDIDLLVVSKEVTKKDLRLLRIDFFDHFEEQKLDIVLDDGEFKNPFTKHIIKGAILLWWVKKYYMIKNFWKNNFFGLKYHRESALKLELKKSIQSKNLGNLKLYVVDIVEE